MRDHQWRSQVVLAIWRTSFGRTRTAPPVFPLLCLLDFFQTFPDKTKRRECIKEKITPVCRECINKQCTWLKPPRGVNWTLGNLRNDDEGTTTTLYIRERLDRGFGFRRENLKVKRTILRKDDGISGHYKFCFSMAFKDLRNSLIISYDDGFIDDEEFVLLYDLYSSKDLDFPYDVYAPFDLDDDNT